MPDLTTDSLEIWTDFGVAHSISCLPVGQITADLGYVPPPNTIAFQFAVDYPQGLAWQQVKEQMRKAKASLPLEVSKRRIHHNKQQEQLGVFKLRNKGNSFKDIAASKSTAESTIKSRQIAARKLVGLPWCRKARNSSLMRDDEKPEEAPEAPDGQKADMAYALGELAPDCQATIRAVYLEGKTVKEYARETNRPVAEVEAILNAGCRVLEQNARLAEYAPQDTPTMAAVMIDFRLPQNLYHQV